MIQHTPPKTTDCSSSLLQRLRGPCEIEAWKRFVSLYCPLIYLWGRSRGLKVQNASDLAHDVMTEMATKLPEFHFDRSNPFRNWLKAVATNKMNELDRRGMESNPIQNDAQLESIIHSIDLFEEVGYNGFLVAQVMKLMKAEFQEATWQAGWAMIVGGRTGKEVASSLGIRENEAYVAKSQILRRVKKELDGLYI